MYKHEAEKEQLSLKTKSKYTKEKNKERGYAPKYLFMMYKDQLEMFEKYKDAKVNTATFLRFLIDSHDIFKIILKNVDSEFNLNTDSWSNEDFNQFYDYLKKFKEYLLKLGGDEK